jgi:hypothetical protein
MFRLLKIVKTTSDGKVTTQEFAKPIPQHGRPIRSVNPVSRDDFVRSQRGNDGSNVTGDKPNDRR